MWFLGAGASASAGIPTAWDMVWEFKQQLYISQRRISPKVVSDLSNPSIRAKLQSYIDSLDHYPPSGDPDEYAELFEAVYPAETDRRAYIDAKVSGAKPSYGHIALASLMRAQLTPLSWTTNFDPLIADACAKVYGGTGPLTTVALDAPEMATQAIGEGRWPVEVKLHGDFHSRRLKNTEDELRHQDSRLRKLFVGSCKRFGLVVVGYSGRDNSIMDTLEEAVKQTGAFPAGLFWLHRGDHPLLPRVMQLLERAKECDLEVAIVRVDNFDEALRDLTRLIDNLDNKILDAFAVEISRWSGAQIPAGSRGWPVLRFNALHVKQLPSVCRLVVCKIGGYREIRKAVANAGVNALVARTHKGVLAFGSDKDIRAAFKDYGISTFDLHTIQMKRLRYESGERGLLRDALTGAISRSRGLAVIRRRSVDMLMPTDQEETVWKPLIRLVGPLEGTIRGHSELEWYEGISTRLDWANDRLWLLVEPRIIFKGITDHNKTAAADFARERTVKRYNRQLNNLVDFWVTLLVGDTKNLYALGIGDGVDAAFQLSSNTAFSRRIRS